MTGILRIRGACLNRLLMALHVLFKLGIAAKKQADQRVVLGQPGPSCLFHWFWMQARHAAEQ